VKEGWNFGAGKVKIKKKQKKKTPQTSWYAQLWRKKIKDESFFFYLVCCQTRTSKEWLPICLKETNNYAR
jgi:hypothetical protein